MHLISPVYTLIVSLALVIMEIVTLPVRQGTQQNKSLNNTVVLTDMALTLGGIDLTHSHNKVQPQGAVDETDNILDTEDYKYSFDEGTNDTQAETTPEYMMELYNNMSKHSPLLHNSNIIRSFKNIPPAQTGNGFVSSIQNLDCFGCRIHSLHFDISTIDRSESINLAELRLYTLIKRDQNSFLGVSRLVKIYEVLDTTDIYGGWKYNYLTSKYIHTLENAWESFEVTSALKRSLQSGSKTEHLEVRIQSMFTAHNGDNMDINADPNHIKQPILVVYSNDIHGRQRDRHEVILHEIAAKKGISSKYSTQVSETNANKYSFGSSNVLHSRTKRSKKYHRNSGCRRRPMYVNFADIDYDTWIIAPRGYQAYQCAGRCWLPISENLSPSNHAIIQTLLHTSYPRRAGRACCVPTKLDPISLLYFDERGVVTYKYMFDGMVVAKCGCR